MREIKRRLQDCRGVYEDFIGIMGAILGLYFETGKENGNYDNGLYRDYRVYRSTPDTTGNCLLNFQPFDPET